MRVVRELGDHGDLVAALGEVLGERLHPRLGRADLRAGSTARRAGSAAGGARARSAARTARGKRLGGDERASAACGERRGARAGPVERVHVVDEPRDRVPLAHRAARLPRRAARAARRRRRARARPVRERLDVARRDEEPGCAVARRRRARRRRRSRPPGAPAASASISATGVPSFAEVSATRRTPHRAGRHPRGSRRSGSGRRRRARAASSSRSAAKRAVADEQRGRASRPVARAPARTPRAGRRPA